MRRESNGELIASDDRRFHTERNERANVFFIPQAGYVYKGAQLGSFGFHTENPVVVQSEYGYSISAFFEKSDEQKELELYIRERQVSELAEKVKQWTDEFHAMRKSQAGGV